MQGCANISKLYFLQQYYVLQFGYSEGSDCFFVVVVVVFRGCPVLICGRFLLSQDSAFLQYTCQLTSRVTFAFFFFFLVFKDISQNVMDYLKVCTGVFCRISIVVILAWVSLQIGILYLLNAQQQFFQLWLMCSLS